MQNRKKDPGYYAQVMHGKMIYSIPRCRKMARKKTSMFAARASVVFNLGYAEQCSAGILFTCVEVFLRNIC